MYKTVSVPISIWIYFSTTFIWYWKRLSKWFPLVYGHATHKLHRYTSKNLEKGFTSKIFHEAVWLRKNFYCIYQWQKHSCNQMDVNGYLCANAEAKITYATNWIKKSFEKILQCRNPAIFIAYPSTEIVFCLYIRQKLVV